MRFHALTLTTVLLSATVSAFTPASLGRSKATVWKASTLEDTETSTNTKKTENRNNDKKDVSFTEQITNSGVASAAAMATAAVNAAVSMKTLEAPQVSKSYIALDDSAAAKRELDEEGLPTVYDKELIEAYWQKERGALNERWGQFVGKTVPFLTKLTTLFIRDGKIKDEQIPALSRQARMDLQDLGPTFIKGKLLPMISSCEIRMIFRSSSCFSFILCFIAGQMMRYVAFLRIRLS